MGLLDGVEWIRGRGDEASFCNELHVVHLRSSCKCAAFGVALRQA